MEDLDAFVAASLDGRDVEDPPPKLRLVTTVARDRILEVGDDTGPLDLRSKNLRCDETRCASDVLGRFAWLSGVLRFDRYLAEDPPRVVVQYDVPATDVDVLIRAVYDLLNALGDPLYENQLGIDRR